MVVFAIILALVSIYSDRDPNRELPPRFSLPEAPCAISMCGLIARQPNHPNGFPIAITREFAIRPIQYKLHPIPPLLLRHPNRYRELRGYVDVNGGV